MSDESSTLGAAEMLALAEHQHDEARRRLAPDDRFLYRVWGGAWTVGFLALWLTSGDDPRVDAATGAGWLYGVLMVAATGTTMWHIHRRVEGVSGASEVRGRRYGVAWLTSFAAYGLLLGGLGRADAPDEVMQLLSPILACLLVGVLYMGGGMIWDDRVQFSLGATIAVVAGLAALVGDPDHFVVLAVGGGGAFLVASALPRHRLQPTA